MEELLRLTPEKLADEVYHRTLFSFGAFHSQIGYSCGITGKFADLMDRYAAFQLVMGVLQRLDGFVNGKIPI